MAVTERYVATDVRRKEDRELPHRPGAPRVSTYVENCGWGPSGIMGNVLLGAGGW